MLRLIGVDFTSAPSARKPIVVARGYLRGASVVLDELVPCADWQGFDAQIAVKGPWLGGFDLPFGLPRELVAHLGWPLQWRAMIERFATQDRSDLRAHFKAFCDARPVGSKFAHRATDGPAGSSPSMKWVNPPVAWMLHAGVPRMLSAGLLFPAHEPHGAIEDLHGRVALEAYPGLIARRIVGRDSYKSDAAAGDDASRRAVRRRIVAACVAGPATSERAGDALPCLMATQAQRSALVADARGDRLDAVLCLLQAGWAAARRADRYGLPAEIDPLEGWIIGAGAL
jgi:hypothetical protein